jgi:hypothetical protein
MNQPSFTYTLGIVAIEMAVVAPVFFAIVFGAVTVIARALRSKPEPPDPREQARLAEFVAEFANRKPGEVPPLLDLCASTPELEHQMA